MFQILKLAKADSGKMKWTEPPDNISQCASLYYHLNMILITLNINEIAFLTLTEMYLYMERVATAIETSLNEPEISCEATSFSYFVFYLHFQLIGEMNAGSIQTV